MLFRSAGGRTTPRGFIRTEEDKNANAGARRQKIWAPRRRTECWSWSVGVSAHYLHLSKRMIATTHGHAWRRSCHVSFTRSGRGFFPPKTPPLPLGFPRARPFLIKGGPRQPRKGGRARTWTTGSDRRDKSRTLQVEQAHGFILGLEAEKRGDLPRAGSAHLLPLAATLPGLSPRTQLVAHHHDDIYPDMQE